MTVVLDTNTLADLMRGDAAVAAALTRHSRLDVRLPQPAAAEIEYGLARLPSSARKERLRARWMAIRDELPRAEWDDAVSDAFGRIKAALEARGLRLEDLDVAIAAHAVALGATLVTSDAALLARIDGLAVVSWRQPPS